MQTVVCNTQILNLSAQSSRCPHNRWPPCVNAIPSFWTASGGHPSGASEIVTTQMPQRHWPCRCCQQPGNYNQFERCYICKHWTATHYKHKCWQAVTDLRTGRQHVVCNCCIKAATHTSPRAMSIRHRQALPPQLTLSSTQQGQQHSDAAPPQGWAPTSSEA